MWSARCRHTHCSQERDIDVSGWIFFVLSFYPLYTFISSVFMSLILLQHITKTPVPPAGFELNIPAGERPQTYALDRAATGIGGSNRQPHQASDRKPSPYTARPLGSAMLNLQSVKATDGTMCPGVDSASKNEWRRPVRKGHDLTTFTVPKVEKIQEP